MKITTISFLVKGDEVFLSEKRRGFGVGFLNGYGGKAAAGEDVRTAAVRELREEAAVDADPKRLQKVAVVDFFDGDEHIFECHVFFLAEWRGDPEETEEMALPQLYPIANLPYERMWKSDRVWLPLIFSGKKIRAKARYEKGMDDMKDFEYVPLEDRDAAC